MKRMILAALLVAALALSTCLADAAPRTPAEAFCGRWIDPYYGRAMLTIRPVYGDDETRFDIEIRWGNSADSEGVWQMDAAWSEAEEKLVYAGGSMALVTYGENGDVAATDVRWDDAEGAFALTGDGILLWDDSREERSHEFRLERFVMEAPSAEALAADYFGRVAAAETGTAGSSLKLALAAHDALRFAFDYDVWNVDIPTLRDNLLAAWESLDEDTAARFDANMFGGLTSLMNDVFDDYESVSGLFEDAGVREDMAYLSRDKDAQICWQTLIAHTLTMGNSEE